MKKIIAAAVAGLGLAIAAPASAIVMGGIDFGAAGAFPLNKHLETLTLAETFVGGVGDKLRGYGQVSTGQRRLDLLRRRDEQLHPVLQVLRLRSHPFQRFAGDLQRWRPGDHYSSSPATNLLSTDSETNMMNIMGAGSNPLMVTPWLKLVGHTFDGPNLSACPAGIPDGHIQW